MMGRGDGEAGQGNRMTGQAPHTELPVFPASTIQRSATMPLATSCSLHVSDTQMAYFCLISMIFAPGTDFRMPFSFGSSKIACRSITGFGVSSYLLGGTG